MKRVNVIQCLVSQPARHGHGIARVTRVGVIAVAALGLLSAPARPAIAQPGPRPSNVTVQPGDTLSEIAVRFYGSADAIGRIASANRLADPDRLVTGMSLTLPATDAAIAMTGNTRPGGNDRVPARQVTVEPGDTLAVIAERIYGAAAFAAALAAANGITDPNLIMIGTKLTAPPASAGSGSASASVGSFAATARGGPLAGKRICLDPGHGGREESGGAFDFGDGRVLREADVTLDISRTLRAWLQADGATVTQTRDADVFLGLDERAAFCNAAGADIAVSVHLNGASNPAINGSLTLFNKPVDRRLAERLAGAFQTGLSRNAPGVPFTAFGSRSFEGRMLLRTTMPAVIVEPVFLSHPSEARALLTAIGQPDSRRNQIVLETYRGIRMYFTN